MSDDDVALRKAVEAYVYGGCARGPDGARVLEGWQLYKKGWEIRLAVDAQASAVELRRLLEAVGFRVGQPYQKRPKRWIVPLYGRAQVERFLSWIAPGMAQMDERSGSDRG